jgi:hypothetical protein
MPMKRYKPEQIVTLLRQIEVGIANGKTTPQACKEAEITQLFADISKELSRRQKHSREAKCSLVGNKLATENGSVSVWNHKSRFRQ